MNKMEADEPICGKTEDPHSKIVDKVLLCDKAIAFSIGVFFVENISFFPYTHCRKTITDCMEESLGIFRKCTYTQILEKVV